jgi:hypothetical protein
MLGQYLNMGHSTFLLESLTFSVQHFQCLNFAVITALFNLITHCGKILLFFYERDVHLMGKHALVCVLNFNL